MEEKPKPMSPSEFRKAQRDNPSDAVLSIRYGDYLLKAARPDRWVKLTRRDGSVTWMQYDEGM